MAVALQVSNISSLVSPPSITSPPFILPPSSKLNSNSNKAYGSIHTTNFKSFRVLYRYSANEEDDNDGENCSFDEAVALFNERAYYKCHDCLESLWYTAEEPTRTLIHGVLQCAVGFYHLFNQNHKGAMMELGEGLGKLRKMNLRSGPFHQFENEISAALEFIYRTQIELAACADDICLAMDQSERSYQLLGNYAAGQQLYHLESDHNQIMYIVFDPQRSYGSDDKSIKISLQNRSFSGSFSSAPAKICESFLEMQTSLLHSIITTNFYF